MGGSFHFDDQWDIVLNPHLGSLRDALAYRPLTRWLTSFTYFLNYQVHGLDFMPGWHAVNILLHAACVLALYAAMRLLQSARPGLHPASALVGALLFALHPLATEPVNYIRARSVILCAIFALLAFCAAALMWRAKSASGKALALLLMAISVALAAISKEVGGIYAAMAVILFGILFVLVPAISARRLWASAAFLVATALAAVAWAWLSGVGGLASERVFNPLSGCQFWGMMTVLWRYVSLGAIPLPSRLSCDHYVPYYPTRVYSAADTDVLLGALALALVIAVAVLLARRRPQISLLVLLAVAGLAPYFFIATVDIMVEYKFYLPLACLSGLAGIAVAWLGKRHKAAALALVAVICVAFAAGTFMRNQVWRTDLSLWQDAMEKAPRKARTVNALAYVLATDTAAADPPRALELALRSFDPRFVDPWWGYDPNMLDTLAEAYYANGKYQEAVLIEESILRAGEGNTGFFGKQLVKFQAARDRNR